MLAQAGAEAAPAGARRRQRPRVLDRVLAFGDEWMPNRMADEDLAARVAELGSALRRSAGSDPVTMVGYPPDPAGFERLAGAGVGRVVFWLPQESAGAVEEGFEAVRGGDRGVPAGG